MWLLTKEKYNRSYVELDYYINKLMITISCILSSAEKY